MSDFSAASILAGTTIAGVTGTMSNRGSWDLQSAFPGEGYYSGVSNTPGAGLIKSGSSLLGVTGNYPSSTYPLAGATTTSDLDTATFDAKIKSASSFEWFGPDGTRYTNAGDADLIASNIAENVTVFGLMGTRPPPPDAWDLRAGVTVGNTVGKLLVNCRNAANNTIYNYDKQIAWASFGDGGITGGTTVDYWDTIDDGNGNAMNMPPNYVSSWAVNRCDGVESEHGDANVWKDVTSNGCSGVGVNCRMKDKITGLEWSGKVNAGQTWSNAVKVCDNLVFDSFADWRLPTQKEALEAFTHGIRSAALAYQHWMSDADLNANVWLATTYSSTTLPTALGSQAWVANLRSGGTFFSNKNVNFPVVCVR